MDLDIEMGDDAQALPLEMEESRNPTADDILVRPHRLPPPKSNSPQPR